MTDGRIEEIACVESAVLQELVAGAVESVRARFQDDISDRADRPPELGFKVTGGHVYGGDSLDGRNHHLQQSRAFVIVDALELKVVALAWQAVHLGLQ